MAGVYDVRRLAGTDDLQALFEFVRGVFAAVDVKPTSSMMRETIDDMRRRAATQDVFVAVASGQIIGAIFCERQADALYLGRLAVSHGWRRQGLADALVEAAKAQARHLGLRRMTLRTRVALPGNRVLFEKHGFRVVGGKIHPGYTEPTDHEMLLTLDGLEAG